MGAEGWKSAHERSWGCSGSATGWVWDVLFVLPPSPARAKLLLNTARGWKPAPELEAVTWH